ncbi:MAG: DMT family transporter [Treponema sp.]|nr:DMT family transporter [Treponema sp.]
MEKTNLKKGIAFALLSGFCFALMGIFVRAAGDIPFFQKTVFRNSIAFIISFSVLAAKAKKDPTVLRIPRGSLKYLIFRAVFGTIGIFGNFYALGKMNVSDANMLNKMSPFFSLLMSFFLLGEKPTALSIISLVTAFTGALLVIKPSANFYTMAPALAGFAGGMGAGFAYANVRKCHEFKVEGYLIIAFFSAFSVLAALPPTIAFFEPMSTKQLLLLIGAGTSAAGGQMGITGAYFNAPSYKISIYEYSQIIFSAILGLIIFSQVPDMLSIAGYVIIIGTALAVFIVTNAAKAKKMYEAEKEN